MESLARYVGNGDRMSFSDFRLFVLNRYEGEWQRDSNVEDIVANLNFDSFSELEKLHEIYTTVAEELNYCGRYEDLLDEIDSQMEDYFEDIFS
jgi:hypothetical protein